MNGAMTVEQNPWCRFRSTACIDEFETMTARLATLETPRVLAFRALRVGCYVERWQAPPLSL
jgi:hypothetical protein